MSDERTLSPQGYIYNRDNPANPFWGTNSEEGSVTATASVDNNTGTPEVEVTRTQEGLITNFDFAFKNLKGAQGEPGKFEMLDIPTTQNMSLDEALMAIHEAGAAISFVDFWLTSGFADVYTEIMDSTGTTTENDAFFQISFTRNPMKFLVLYNGSDTMGDQTFYNYSLIPIDFLVRISSFASMDNSVRYQFPANIFGNQNIPTYFAASVVDNNGVVTANTTARIELSEIAYALFIDYGLSGAHQMQNFYSDADKLNEIYYLNLTGRVSRIIAGLADIETPEANG